jgi:hypothetical protein
MQNLLSEVRRFMQTNHKKVETTLCISLFLDGGLRFGGFSMEFQRSNLGVQDWQAGRGRYSGQASVSVGFKF